MQKKLEIMLQVIFEDNHIIAVNKPAGILVQGDETGDISLDILVKKYIKSRYDKPGDVYLATLHRIDRPVSGVVVFARTSKAAERMSKYFVEKKIDKTYLAITAQRPEVLEGRLIHYIVKNHETNTVKAYESEKKGGKEAILDYEFIGQIDRANVLIRVKILTGRPHQIRAQLARIGCIINGDLKYGAAFPNVDKSISLHCRSMGFVHPTTKEYVTIQADLPKNRLWAEIDEMIEAEGY